ncbi:hypothetical protein PSPO01_04553 [Paraphaeosphaeria sporulosa]
MPTPGANCSVMRTMPTPGANCTVQKQMPTPGANCIVHDRAHQVARVREMVQPTYPRDFDRGLEALYYTLVGSPHSSTSTKQSGATSHIASATGPSDTQQLQSAKADKERKGWRRVLGRFLGVRS